MNEQSSLDTVQPEQPAEQSKEIEQLFAELAPHDVEQFYHAYQLRAYRRRREEIVTAIAALQQKITDNNQLMQQVAPSAVAMATLAQLQAYGVEDADLLDRMLERGEDWLDHSMQLLERCQELDMIGDDYTAWCEHALEGAYDWIESINETEAEDTPVTAQAESSHTTNGHQAETTEALFLEKLMYEEDEVEAANAAQQRKTTKPLPRITGPLLIIDEIETPTEQVPAQPAQNMQEPQSSTETAPTLTSIPTDDTPELDAETTQTPSKPVQTHKEHTEQPEKKIVHIQQRKVQRRQQKRGLVYFLLRLLAIIWRW